MAKYDLTVKMCQYMDLHLTFPVLEYLLERDIYPREQIYQEIIYIVNKKTNLVDYTTDILGRLNVGEKIPDEFVQRKQQVLAKLSDLLQDVAPLTKAISSCDDNVSTVRDSKTFILELQKRPEYKPDWVDKAYNIAKYCYECGSYDLALSNLYFCSVVMQPTDKNYLNVLWGTLATNILGLNWAGVLDDITRLREFIDNSNFSTIQALQQRTWLIHWTSFVLANHIKGREFIIDLYLYKPLYLNTIQTMCPHMLRYLAVALILSPGRRNALKDVIKIIQQESYTYRDPITEFLEHLYVNFDFEGARLKLHECQSVILNDFLIHSELLNFVENARLMMLETFCRIHQCITIGMLADKLNMDPNEVELWIVNLIRGAHLDAKIDSKLAHVVMGTQPLSPYQQLVEKIDSLSMRSEALTNLVERKLKSKNQDSGEGNWKYQK